MGGNADKQLNHRLAVNLNDLTLQMPPAGSFISQEKVFWLGDKDGGMGAELCNVLLLSWMKRFKN